MAPDCGAGRRRRGAIMSMFGPAEASQLPTAHYGVVDLAPADGRQRLTDALAGVQRDGRQHVVEGRPLPMNDADAPLQPPLDQLADVSESPPGAAPEPTLGQLVAELAARVAALENGET